MLGGVINTGSLKERRIKEQATPANAENPGNSNQADQSNQREFDPLAYFADQPNREFTKRELNSYLRQLSMHIGKTSVLTTTVCGKIADEIHTEK